MASRYAFLLPAYKGTFLCKAIESILGQDYKDFELVIVNDASPENIDSIVQAYNDPRIRFYKNEHNIGGTDLIAQWQRCIEYTESEYIIMASDDDVYHSGYLSEMNRLATKYPQVDVFHCRIGRIDAEGQLSDVSSPCSEWESAIESLYYRNISHRMQTLPEFMYRRKALLETGGFINFPLGYYSDDATSVCVGVKHGIVCSDQYLFLSRSSGINISSHRSTLPQRLQACEAFLHWTEHFVETLTAQNEIETVLLQRIKQLLWFRQQDMAHNIIQQMDSVQLKQLLHDRQQLGIELISRQDIWSQLLRKMFHNHNR